MKKILISFLIVVVLGVVAVQLYTWAQADARGVVVEPNVVDIQVAFSATTTSATSSPINIKGAKRVTWEFSSNDLGADFSVQVMVGDPDVDSGVAQQGDAENNQDFVTYNKLIDNVTNTNSQQLTRVGVVSTVNGTSTYSMDLENDLFSNARCIAGVSGGKFEESSTTCKALIEF